MTDKEDLMKTIEEVNNYCINKEIPCEYFYDDVDDEVVMRDKNRKILERISPDFFYSRLNIGGWDNISEEDKKLK